MAELKPRPFCGAKENDNDKPIGVGYMNILESYVVVCDRCGASCGEHDEREEAIEAWNRRAEDEKPL